MQKGRLKHFGWGREGEGLTAEEEAAALDRYRNLFNVDHFDEVTTLSLSKIELRPPRLAPPAALASRCSSEPYDRIAHTYGKSFSDYARGLLGHYDNAPDVVAYPRSESEVAAILDWAGGAQAALTPFGADHAQGNNHPRSAAHEPSIGDRSHLTRRTHRGRGFWSGTRGSAQAASVDLAAFPAEL